MVNALLFLKRDHNAVKELFRRYDKTDDEAFQTKKDLFDQMKEELEKHALVEEEIFYPAVRDAKGSGDLTDHALDEHNKMKSVLTEISLLEPQSEKFDEKMDELMENVEHHIKDEEKEMFKEVRALMQKQTLEELGKMLEARKNELLIPRDVGEDIGAEA